MRSLLASLSFLLLSLSTITMSYRLAAMGFQRVTILSPYMMQSAITPFLIQRSFLTLSRPNLAPLSAEIGSTNGGDTVVARCTEKLAAALKPINLKVTSSNDDPNGSHIQILCVSTEFEGKNIVQRQRLVYKALWEELSGPVHAVDSIVAKTPVEAGL